jgi:hypothetical protein
MSEPSSPTARGAAGALGGVPAAQVDRERELEQLIFEGERQLLSWKRELGRIRRGQASHIQTNMEATDGY